MIDFHAHMGTLYRDGYPERHRLTAEQLVSRMDRDGISHSVLLPLESPEGGWGWLLTEEVVEARNQYPDRLIAFCCFDPRYPRAGDLVKHFVEKHGCKGFGEHVNGLAFDDPRNKAIYAACNDYALPLDFEINTSLCWDEVGLPRLESCLKEFPDVRFVGHGPAFWSAMSADDPRAGYPPGPIKPGGAVDRLLAEHENLYADLSAGSGYNAMTRDPEYTLGFIDRHWGKLLWGSDIMHPTHEIPQVEWFRSLDLLPEVAYAIAEGNARELLGLPQLPGVAEKL